MENKENDIDNIELAKEMNAVVVWDERIKNKDKKLAEKVETHNKTLKNAIENNEDYSKEIQKVLSEHGIEFEMQSKSFGKIHSEYAIKCNEKGANKIAKLEKDIQMSVECSKPI